MKQSTIVGALSAAGLLIALGGTPAQGAVGGTGSTNQTITTSTSTSSATHDTKVNVNNYSTQVLGLASWTGCTDGGGFVDKQVYNQTFLLPTSSQEVTAAYQDARDRVEQELNSTGGRGQVQISSSTQVNQTQSSNTVENSRNSTETVSLEETIGPGTILIGDRDAGGTLFEVLAGTTNLNINTHTHTDIFTTTTVTTNTNTLYTVTGELYSSPIILDLVGSGTIEASGGNWRPHQHSFYPKHRRLFDFFGNGFPVAMEWVGPNDGLLVKPKADGSVDGSCLFGNATGFNHGYEQLATMDTNLDGRVAGKELAGLSVWQDKNTNAKCEPGELRTLKQLGISELNLRHKDFKSTFVMNGKTQAMFDWWPTMFEIKKTKRPV